VQLAPAAFDLARVRSAQQRGLLVELVAYLQHRQGATGAWVTEHVRADEARAARNEQRHDDVLQRLDGIERRLAGLDRQVGELRVVTETLRGPALGPRRNGVAASTNGHVKDARATADIAAPASDEGADELVETARPHGKALLRVEGLAKEIGDADILRDITFDVYEDEILGLIGPNGAGKTTLMECLAGMRPRSGGTFSIGDEVPAAWNPKDLLFYLPNNVLPYAELFTLEVLTFFGRLYEVDQERWEQIVLRDLSLAPALGKRVSALSKGNMQRLLIALALMSPQPLLALDEPFDGLDLHQTQAMMGILRGLRAQSRTLLLCIHQLNDAERICDRFLLLSTGRLVGVGTLAELRNQTGLSSGSLEEIFLALT
jgi:ABC-type multidrug transport system ATPase subunit